MHEVIRLHGLPTDIVSDRDKLFTSRFFVELQRLLGTRQAMSTAYHPQPDGQTERANRVLQEVLRHVTSLVQDDWDVKLPCVELTLNTATRRSLGKGISPFMLGHGREARLAFNVDLPVRNLCANANDNPSTVERGMTSRKFDSNMPRALEQFQELTALVSLTRECLGASRNRMK
jgi:transposase InsO family protein